MLYNLRIFIIQQVKAVGLANAGSEFRIKVSIDNYDDDEAMGMWNTIVTRSSATAEKQRVSCAYMRS